MSDASNTCHTCNETISTAQFIKVGGYKFHKDHFVCVLCGDSLHGKKFHHREGKFYCSKDFIDKFCHMCRRCNEKIATGSVIPAFGGYYHPEHFVCFVCSLPFKNGKYYEVDQQPYCEEDYFLLTAEKCQQCSKAVTDTDFVKVQGKIYHKQCLSCSFCSKALAPTGSIFQKDGKAYCRPDYLNLFCKRCTACGDHILKHCITVNDEFYHPDCLQCSVCNKKLDKYICISGHLRCSEHTDSPCDKFNCSSCGLPVDDEVVLSVGKKLHAACYKCSFCQTPLQKASCKLKDGQLCCPDCMMKKEDGSDARPFSPSSLSLNTTLPLSSSSSSSSTSSTSSSSSRSPRDSDAEEDLRSPLAKKGSKAGQKEKGSARKGSKSANSSPSSGKIEWKKGELIGKGSFGKVYMAMNIGTGELIAVKQVRLNTAEEQEQAALIQNEIGLMENLRHPNIVSLLGTQRKGNKLNILMEYVPGKSLDTLLEKFGCFSEKVVRSYTKQLLQALSYAHAHRIVHRDVKGKNILIDTKGNLKLADWGSAKRFTNVMSKDAPSLSYNYTPLWTAPEVLVGDYNNKVDIWSLGCVIIEMASAKAPWAEYNFENPFRALYHIGNTDSIPKIPDTLSETGKEFVLQTLRRDPDLRPSADECLLHDWLQGIDDEDVEYDDEDDDEESGNWAIKSPNNNDDSEDDD